MRTSWLSQEGVCSMELTRLWTC